MKKLKLLLRYIKDGEASLMDDLITNISIFCHWSLSVTMKGKCIAKNGQIEFLFCFLHFQLPTLQWCGSNN